VLHNLVVAVGVNTDISIMRETEIHDGAENAMYMWITGNAVDNVV
jgi:hypothetical protein